MPPKSVEIHVQNSVVREGDEVTLLCSVKGAKPLAQVTWKNGTTPIEQVDTLVDIQVSLK